MVSETKCDCTCQKLEDSSVFHRIIDTELEGTHDDQVQFLALHKTPHETHHAISTSFSQKTIPVLEGRT